MDSTLALVLIVITMIIAIAFILSVGVFIPAS